jgi:glycerate dehydrogenase
VTEIVALDGFTLNPGDNPWDEVERCGNLRVFDRTPDDAVAILQRIGDAAIVLTNKTALSAATLRGAKRLRGVCVLATGVNVVDLEAASELGIPVCNIPQYSTASTAQHTIALLLELTNRVGLHDRAVHDGEWVRSPDFCFTKAPLQELAGLTFGIIGFGAIGSRVGAIARALGMHVLAVHRAEGGGDPDWLTRIPLDELVERADVVSLHCPLTPETHGLVNRHRLERMKRSALLINAGRGALVVEAELAQALERGEIAGAALDVLSSEPPAADNPLLAAPNCVITPHNAWLTLAARRRAMHITAENVRGLLRGVPLNVANAEALAGSPRPTVPR